MNFRSSKRVLLNRVIANDIILVCFYDFERFYS